jgi:hypothetical protein
MYHEGRGCRQTNIAGANPWQTKIIGELVMPGLKVSAPSAAKYN